MLYTYRININNINKLKTKYFILKTLNIMA